MKIQKNKMLGGGGVDSYLSTSNNNNNLCESKIKNNISLQSGITKISLSKQKKYNATKSIKLNNESILCDKNKINYKNNNKDKIYNKLVKSSNDTNLVCNSKTKAQSKQSLLQSTILLLSWLFVFVLSLTLLCCINNKVNISNNLIAVEAVEDTGGEIDFRLNDASRDGSEEKPYIIASAMNLRYLSNHQSENNFLNASYVQTADIIYTTNSWIPIGNYSKRFKGTYDGRNYFIKFTENIKIENLQGDVYAGLFGCAESNLININIVWEGGLDVNTKSSYRVYAGGLVGRFQRGDTIENVSVFGSIKVTSESGLTWVGGITGSTDMSTIKQCYNSANINVTSVNADIDSGGIGGHLYGYMQNTQVYDCFNLGNITCDSSGVVSIGGIGSGFAVTINNSYNVGQLIANASNSVVGGIGTQKNAEVNNCYYLDSCGGTFDKGTPKTIEEMKTQSTYERWDFETIWGISEINNGYPYLRVFTYCITYQANNGTEESQVKEYLKNSGILEVAIAGNEFGFVNNNMEIIGWQLVGDESGKIYNVGETITLNNDLVLQAVWGVAECEVKFNINTNIGVLFMISNEEGFKQQIFVDKTISYNDSKPTFTLTLKPNTVYTVIISAFYTTNINFADTNGQPTTTIPSGQTLTNNILTFTASKNLIIRLNLNAFVGNNGIVI